MDLGTVAARVVSAGYANPQEVRFGVVVFGLRFRVDVLWGLGLGLALVSVIEYVRTRSWKGPPRGKRVPRAGIGSTVFGVRA